MSVLWDMSAWDVDGLGSCLISPWAEIPGVRPCSKEEEGGVVGEWVRGIPVGVGVQIVGGILREIPSSKEEEEGEVAMVREVVAG